MTRCMHDVWSSGRSGRGNEAGLIELRLDLEMGIRLGVPGLAPVKAEEASEKVGDVGRANESKREGGRMPIEDDARGAIPLRDCGRVRPLKSAGFVDEFQRGFSG
ncbi:BZ3500_MvSof-1268-A1-R1_Chr2-2g04959 [Microbotryum saponariae]|uniref:BZ3500_MvSof-1268-A1-R1_Chr2-2g04959 protein n=1 Tax=Microbotryum saponariae TaxID=289078 RepID=A0A2X0N5U2_9BASI|nr:BZ3500_MvSof-1268-A1-R1_Chr2-2g04959 [Microbotryum saponariae]SDA00566.1 BZ3501_MvSof-1269-A2-R1_Chr2-2g04633 [Microbotryum saponariae]